MNNARARGWLFTINNYTDQHQDVLRGLAQQPGCRYLIFGREVGEETHTPHLQCYVYYNTLKSFDQIKELLPYGAHIERANGTAEQNKKYCSKTDKGGSGDYEEFGECPMSQAEKGQRGAEFWREQRNIIENGELEDIDDKLFITNHSAILSIRRGKMETHPNLDHTTLHDWFYGGPGTGKSFAARQQYPEFFDKLLNKWWDGYQGEDAVLLDDLDINHAKLGSHIKRWADIYPFKAEVKYGAIQIRPKKIIITSNYHPHEIWGRETSLCQAIMRRFKIVHYRALGEEPIQE